MPVKTELLGLDVLGKVQASSVGALEIKLGCAGGFADQVAQQQQRNQHDFGTIYGRAQRRGLGGLPASDSALNSIRVPINTWGTLSNWTTNRTTPTVQRNIRPRPSFTVQGQQFVPQTRPIYPQTPYIHMPTYRGLLP